MMTSNKCNVLPIGNSNVRTAVGRLTYPYLHTPKTNKKGSDKYEVSVAFDHDADLTALTDTMVTVAKEKFGDNIPAKVKIKIKTLQGKNKKLVFDNDAKNYNLVQEGEMKGFRVLQCSDPDMPTMVNSDNKPVFGLDDEPNDRTQKIKKQFYAGCYVSVVTNIYAGEFKEDNLTNKYLSTYLKGVKFVRDGDPLGAPRLTTSDMFGNAPTSSDESDSDGFNDDDDDDDDDGF